MVTKSQLKAFKYHKLLFSYMLYPFPVSWDFTSNQFVPPRSLKGWLILWFSLFYQLQHGMMCIFGATWYGIVAPRQDCSFVKILVFVIFGCIWNTVALLGAVIIKDLRKNIASTNQLIHLKEVLHKDVKKIKVDFIDHVIISDTFNYVVLTVGAAFPFIILLMAIVGRFDVTYYIVSDIYQDYSRINTSHGILELLPFLIPNFSHFLFGYRQVFLLYQVLRSCIEFGIYILLSITFWVIVVCGWVTVNGFGKMPSELYCGFVFFGGGIIAGKMYAVPKVAKICDSFHELVDTVQKYNRKEYASSKLKVAKVRMLQAYAIAPIKHAVLCAFTSLWYGLLEPRADFGLVKLGVVATAMCICLTITLIGFVLIPEIKGYVTAANEIFELEKKMLEGPSKSGGVTVTTIKYNKPVIADCFYLATVVAGVTFPFIILAVAIIGRFDAAYYIISGTFPHLSDSTSGAILTILIRCLILFSVLIDGTRIAIQFFLVAYTILNSVNVIAHLELGYLKDFPEQGPSKSGGVTGTTVQYNKPVIADCFYLATVVAGVTFPFIILAVAIIGRFDAAYYIISGTFPHLSPSTSGAILTILIRCLILFSILIDGTRMAIQSFLVAFTLLNSVNVIAHLELGYLKDFTEQSSQYIDFCIKVYKEGALIYKKLQFCIESVVYIFLMITFWVIIGCTWIAVKGIDALPIPIYSAYVFFGGMFAFGKFYTLRKLINVCELAYECVDLARQQTKLRFAETKMTEPSFSDDHIRITKPPLPPSARSRHTRFTTSHSIRPLVPYPSFISGPKDNAVLAEARKMAGLDSLLDRLAFSRSLTGSHESPTRLKKERSPSAPTIPKRIPRKPNSASASTPKDLSFSQRRSQVKSAVTARPDQREKMSILSNMKWVLKAKQKLDSLKGHSRSISIEGSEGVAKLKEMLEQQAEAEKERKLREKLEQETDQMVREYLAARKSKSDYTCASLSSSTPSSDGDDYDDGENDIYSGYNENVSILHKSSVEIPDSGSETQLVPNLHKMKIKKRNLISARKHMEPEGEDLTEKSSAIIGPVSDEAVVLPPPPFFTAIPGKARYKIYQYLSSRDRASCQLVCRQMRNEVRRYAGVVANIYEDSLWGSSFMRDIICETIRVSRFQQPRLLPNQLVYKRMYVKHLCFAGSIPHQLLDSFVVRCPVIQRLSVHCRVTENMLYPKHRSLRRQSDGWRLKDAIAHYPLRLSHLYQLFIGPPDECAQETIPIMLTMFRYPVLRRLVIRVGNFLPANEAKNIHLAIFDAVNQHHMPTLKELIIKTVTYPEEAQFRRHLFLHRPTSAIIKSSQCHQLQHFTFTEPMLDYQLWPLFICEQKGLKTLQFLQLVQYPVYLHVIPQNRHTLVKIGIQICLWVKKGFPIRLDMALFALCQNLKELFIHVKAPFIPGRAEIYNFNKLPKTLEVVAIRNCLAQIKDLLAVTELPKLRSLGLKCVTKHQKPAYFLCTPFLRKLLDMRNLEELYLRGFSPAYGSRGVEAIAELCGANVQGQAKLVFFLPNRNQAKAKWVHVPYQKNIVFKLVESWGYDLLHVSPPAGAE
ncbi:unnamed protein product [Orchesella dallaii]|uniref:F-box domain-containing protein n=1 Tax=Orchesella dallaii TaxID=48710 RepID=A0ABP1S8B0_9HEXA